MFCGHSRTVAGLGGTSLVSPAGPSLASSLSPLCRLLAAWIAQMAGTACLTSCTYAQRACDMPSQSLPQCRSSHCGCPFHASSLLQTQRQSQTGHKSAEATAQCNQCAP